MTTHCLQCSVCGQEFSFKEEWNNHLLTSSHQKPAQNECDECWWEDPLIRRCCAVLFSSYQITKELAADIVSLFGNKLPGRFLTDFALSKGNPQVAVLQFESKKVVETVVKETQGGSVTINGKLVQIKLATDFLELQWKHLFHRVLLPEQGHLPVPSNNVDLLSDFNWIRSCTVINATNRRKFNVILELIPTILRKSNLKVFLFRNYVQGIKFNGTQQVLIFLCKTGSKKRLVPLEAGVTSEFINESRRIALMSDFTIIDAPQTPLKTVPGECFQFKHGNAILELSLVTDFRFIHEVQLSRMLDYLCKFDSRLNGVLTLAAFWSNCNKVFFTSERVRNGEAGVSSAMDPVILQWFVVLFMTKENVIPSVRSIMERPHRKQTTRGFQNKANVDVGFDDSDDHYLSEWRSAKIQPEENSKEYMHSIVTLTAAMFRYFSTELASPGMVIIPQDGEMLTKCEILTRERFKGMILDNGVKMLHPLNDRWRLPFDLKMWKASVRGEMERAAAGLEEFLGGADMKLKDALGHNSVNGTITEKWLGDWNVLSKTIH